MTQERYKVVPAVYLMPVHHGKILLLKRFNTGYEDGNYSLVAGHVEDGETAVGCMVREAQEEAGLIIDPKDLSCKVSMYRKAETRTSAEFFFEVKHWDGEPRNMEPHKCSELSWFPMDNLPTNTIPYIWEAIRCYNAGIPFTDFGF